MACVRRRKIKHSQTSRTGDFIKEDSDMHQTKPTGMARVWRTLVDLDQALIELCAPRPGSLSVRFGFAGSRWTIGVFIVTLIGCVTLNLMEGKRFLSFEGLLSFAWFSLFIVYSLRTPAKDRSQERSNRERFSISKDVQ
jgi:hypothetical protein